MSVPDHDRMAELVADAPSKSEKIRILHSNGVPKADIGRFLGIRYQHVYNVLLREVAARETGLPREAGKKGPDAAGTASYFDIVVGEGGTLRLPEAWLAGEGMKAGDSLVCRHDANGLTLMSKEAALRHLGDIARERMPEQAGLIEILLRQGGPGLSGSP
jgi:hypothetical protein